MSFKHEEESTGSEPNENLLEGTAALEALTKMITELAPRAYRLPIVQLAVAQAHKDGTSLLTILGQLALMEQAMVATQMVSPVEAMASTVEMFPLQSKEEMAELKAQRDQDRKDHKAYMAKLDAERDQTLGRIDDLGRVARVVGDRVEVSIADLLPEKKTNKGDKN